MPIWTFILFISFVMADSYHIAIYSGSIPGYNDGSLLNANFYQPSGLVVDEYGWMIIADSGNNVLRGITPSDSEVFTFAGTGLQGQANGNANSATFFNPVDVCYSYYDKFIYIADSNNHRIRGISLDNNVITRATGFTFNNPRGVAADKSGIIYVADTGNSLIRKIALNDTVSTLAGSGQAIYKDGIGTSAAFNQPRGLAIDSTGKLLYVADTGNSRIRLINMTDGTARVSTVGQQLDSQYFKNPSDVDIDFQGNLYVTDSGKGLIKRIYQNGTPEILTFSGFAGFSYPYGIHVASMNTIYVSDQLGAKIYKISVSTSINSPTQTTLGSSASPQTTLGSSASPQTTLGSSASPQITSVSTQVSGSITSPATAPKSSTTSSKVPSTNIRITSNTETSSKSPRPTSTSTIPATQTDWSFQLISSPFPLQKDIVLFGDKIPEPFEISFDIVITGLKDSKGFIFVMDVNGEEYLDVFLEPSSYKLIVSMNRLTGLARRQSASSFSASADLIENYNQTINILIGKSGASLYVDNIKIQDFLSYGIPSSVINVRTSPFGSSVALATINHLTISSSPDISIAPTNFDVTGSKSLDIPLIVGATVGSICFIAIMAYFGLRFRSASYQNVSAGEANVDNATEGDDSHQDQPEPERRNRRTRNSRRRARERNTDPTDPAPPEYHVEEPPPIYVSNLDLHGTN